MTRERDSFATKKKSARLHATGDTVRDLLLGLICPNQPVVVNRIKKSPSRLVSQNCESTEMPSPRSASCVAVDFSHTIRFRRTTTASTFARRADCRRRCVKEIIVIYLCRAGLQVRQRMIESKRHNQGFLLAGKGGLPLRWSATLDVVPKPLRYNGLKLC